MRVYPPNQWDHAIDAAREYAVSFGVAYLLDAGVGVTVGGHYERRRYPNLRIVARVRDTPSGVEITKFIDYPSPVQTEEANRRDEECGRWYQRQKEINEMYARAARKDAAVLPDDKGGGAAEIVLLSASRGPTVERITIRSTVAGGIERVTVQWP